MATTKQKVAAKKNIKKAQTAWKKMTPRQRAIAQPDGRKRAKPGTTKKGKFFRIEVREKSQFKSFKTQDVGKKGGVERVAGHRSSGSWDTQAWLIDKKRAIVTAAGSLKAKYKDVQEVLNQLGSKPKLVKGDVFKAKPRKNIAEKDKPTKAQKSAQKKNIKKAQTARRKS